MAESKIICGDCLEVMRTMSENSVDAIVTDPPYHLTQVSRGGSPRTHKPDSPFGRHHIGERGFMGKTWDGGGISFRPETWTEMLRVAKPGTHLLAFGGTRTHHRIACAIEDAGWIIFDCMMWVYGTGFCKSLNIGAAIDKKFGAEREVIGTKVGLPGYSLKHSGAGGVLSGRADGSLDNSEKECEVTTPATEAAKKWNGYGTGLKPAYEPIILAMKPLEGTYVENVLKYGTGALNIDRCRIGSETITQHGRQETYSQSMAGKNYAQSANSNPHIGRWPANFIIDDSEEVLALFPHTKSGTGAVKRATGAGYAPNALGKESRPVGTPNIEYGDEGSAARFFYCAKASTSERHDGLNGSKNSHPTIKPLALMTYLCRLVTQPGGLILDPFAGSGSTGKAALAEGFKFIGIEQDPEYVEIAKKRCGLNGSRSLQQLFDEAVQR